MKINICSVFFGTSGYASHARSLANALQNLGCSVKVETPLFPQWEMQATNQEINMINKEWQKDGYTIMITTPPFYSYTKNEHTSKKLIGFVVFEGSSIPPSWAKYTKQCDLLFVPSLHVLEALREQDKETRAFIVPHGVDTSVFYPLPKKEKELFTFVCNKGWSQGLQDRGGVQYLIQAFCEEFNKDEKVRLFLKLNPAYLPQGWSIETELAKLNLPSEHPPIVITTDTMTMQQINEFVYNEGDVYVCSQRSDGFNITGLEAMSCQLPTIQTAYGGQTDYVTAENGWLIPFDLEPVKHDMMYEDCQWATPRKNDLKRLLRHAFTNRLEVKAKGLQALEDSQRWTWSATARKIIDLLNKEA